MLPTQIRFVRALSYFYQQDYNHAISEAALGANGGAQQYSDLLSFYCHIFKKSLLQARLELNRLTTRFPHSETVLDAKAIDLKYETAKSYKARAACYRALKTSDLKHQDLSQLRVE